MSETTDEFLNEMREYAGYFTQFITRVEVDRLFALATRGAKIPDALAEAEAKLVKARDDALEEAAKITAMVPAAMIGSSEPYPKAYKDACYHAAAAIRSLKSVTET